MDFPDIKKLKKLAAACRKAGISNFRYLKDGTFEFSLDPNYQDKLVKPTKKQTSVSTAPNTPFESDTLSEEALLFWSVGQTPGAEAKES